MIASIVSKDTTKAGVFRNVQVAPVAAAREEKQEIKHDPKL